MPWNDSFSQLSYDHLNNLITPDNDQYMAPVLDSGPTLCGPLPAAG